MLLTRLDSVTTIVSLSFACLRVGPLQVISEARQTSRTAAETPGDNRTLLYLHSDTACQDFLKPGDVQSSELRTVAEVLQACHAAQTNNFLHCPRSSPSMCLVYGFLRKSV